VSGSGERVYQIGNTCMYFGAYVFRFLPGQGTYGEDGEAARSRERWNGRLVLCLRFGCCIAICAYPLCTPHRDTRVLYARNTVSFSQSSCSLCSMSVVLSRKSKDTNSISSFSGLRRVKCRSNLSLLHLWSGKKHMIIKCTTASRICCHRRYDTSCPESSR
jgi:hypothetical protein